MADSDWGVALPEAALSATDLDWEVEVPRTGGFFDAGGPVGLRAKVSGLSIQDKLATVQKIDPHAYIEDDLIVMRHPETHKLVYLDPPTLEAGDVADLGREVSGVLGGIAGGVGGFSAAGPAGAWVGGSAGSTAAGQAYDAVARLSGAEDSRSDMELVRDAAIEFGLDLTLSKLSDVGLSKMASGLRRGDDAAKVFAEAGIEPTGGIAGSRGLSAMESGLESAPFTGIAEARERVMTDVGKYIREGTGEMTARGTPEELGAMIEGSGYRFADALLAASEKAYAEVDQLIPVDTRIPSRAFRAQLNRYLDAFKDDPALIDVLTSPLVKRLREAADAEDLSYGALRTLRTEIGETLAKRQGHLIEDSSVAELNLLYGALSQDMKSAAESISDEAAQRLLAADHAWSAGMKTIENAVTPTMRPKSPEQIYTNVIHGARRGPTQVGRLREFMSEDELAELGAGAIEQASYARAGAQDIQGEAFSPSTYLTETSRLQDSGLLEGAPGELHERAAVMADALREAERSINRSKTATGVLGATPIGVAGGALVSGNPELAAGALASYLPAPAVAKLMRSDWFVRFLRNPTEATVRREVAKKLPGWLGAHGLKGEQGDKLLGALGLSTARDKEREAAERRRSDRERSEASHRRSRENQAAKEARDTRGRLG